MNQGLKILKTQKIRDWFEVHKNKNPVYFHGKFWCRMSDLNQRPSDYKSDALPAELIRQCDLLYRVDIHISS